MKYQTFKQLLIDTKCQYHSTEVGITSVQKLPFVRISTSPDKMNFDASIIVCASQRAIRDGLVVKGMKTKSLYDHNTAIVERDGVTYHKFVGKPTEFEKADLD